MSDLPADPFLAYKWGNRDLDAEAALHYAVGPNHVRYVQAAPDHRDPPGAVRWVAIQPDGSRVPKGAVTIEDLAANGGPVARGP